MAKERTELANLDDEGLRKQLRRTCMMKTLQFLESDGLVEMDEVKVAVQAWGVVAKEVGTEVHRDALTFAMQQAVTRGVKQITSKAKDAA